MSFFKKLFGSKEESEFKKKGKVKSDLDSFRKVPWMTDLRLENIAICLKVGFIPSNSLPTELERELRPSIEIAKRLHAIKALVFWLMINPEDLADSEILNFVKANGLQEFMTREEQAILISSRDDEQARNSIGWKFENAWSLAWYFGYTEPDIKGEMMTGEQMQEILSKQTCALNETVDEWMLNTMTLSEEKLSQKEDLFYCIHNAVRSAQMGRETVPKNFNPAVNGGVIHERRHSLTWMLSKGIDWELTDLST